MFIVQVTSRELYGDKAIRFVADQFASVHQHFFGGLVAQTITRISLKNGQTFDCIETVDQVTNLIRRSRHYIADQVRVIFIAEDGSVKDDGAPSKKGTVTFTSTPSTKRLGGKA